MILTLLGILLLLIVMTIGVAMFSFTKKIEKQKNLLFTYTLDKSPDTLATSISEGDLAKLPPLMKNFLRKVGVVGQPKYCNLTFTQDGVIKTDPKKKWLSFKARQYMSSGNSGFIWHARAFPLFIVDRFQDGIGEVKVNLLGLKNLAVISNPETNQSALGRYFGELIWFPIGFLDEEIKWETVNDDTLKGVISKNGISFEGFFHFTKDGLIHSFSGQRYRDTSLEDFVGKAEDYTLMDGLLIPKVIKAIWELEEGPLEYFKAEIGNYNISRPAQS